MTTSVDTFLSDQPASRARPVAAHMAVRSVLDAIQDADLANKGPLPALQQAINQGILEHNTSQLEVMAHLQALHDWLLAPETAPSTKKGFSSWLFTGGGAAKQSEIKGAYIVGGVGIGKTFLMDMFAASVPSDIVWRDHFHRFMYKIHDMLLVERKAGYAADPGPLLAVAKKLAQQYRVICLDEFFVNNVADAMIMSRLFSSLFEQGLILVTTSNVRPQDLYKDGLQRDRFLPFIDTLLDYSQVFTVTAPRDYRQAVLHLDALYISPLGRRTESQLQDTFRALNDGSGGERGMIEVRGREVYVPLIGNRVAFFRFDDLCNKPLGAEDYYAITENFGAICLADVPELSDERLSEVRRFINLIDVLYEARVLLVVSAAAPASDLYRGSLAPDFERTASRLTEMQSQDYLDAINPQLRLWVPISADPSE